MTNTMKVRQFYNLNQFIIEGEGKKIFQSYDSTIAIIDYQKQTLTFGRDWDYSHTTMKHLYMFLDEEFYLSNINQDIEKALHTNNKRKALQSLIDKGIILYDNEL